MSHPTFGPRPTLLTRLQHHYYTYKHHLTLQGEPYLWRRQGSIYYFSFAYKQHTYYKLGYTTRSTQQRLNELFYYIPRTPYKIIGIVIGGPSIILKGLEEHIHTQHRDNNIINNNTNRPKVHKILNGGNSEVYSYNILGLEGSGMVERMGWLTL